MARIAVLASAPDWHTRRLIAAFDERGAIATVCALADCAFHIDWRGGPGIVLPGFADNLPDAVFVKTVATGSFEQVTFRLSILHALDALGVPVINDARAIERSVDKSMTSFLLRRAGLPTPSTWTVESEAEAARLLAASAGELVIKPLFGSRGRGLQRLAPGVAPPPVEEYDGVYYLQEYVGRASEWRDYRVFVIGARAVAAMRRHGASWVTNVARGGSCEGVQATGRLAELAVAALATVGADYGGVDLIEDEEGALQVLEVNSMPAWHGLQGVTETDIAAALADHVLARLGSR